LTSKPTLAEFDAEVRARRYTCNVCKSAEWSAVCEGWKPGIPIARVYQYLCKHYGYKGCEGTVRDHIKMHMGR